MSIKTTIVWLLVAIALGAAALLMLNRSGGGGGAGTPAVGQPIMNFDAGALRSVRIEHADGSREAVEHGADGWRMRVKVAGRADGAGDWPVPSNRIESLARLMLDARVRAAATKGDSLGDQPTVVTLTFEEGLPIVVKLADRSIAGTALVEVERMGKPGETLRAKVDDQLHGLFRGGAPREWRDRTALPAAGLEASRIRLSNSAGDMISLGRVQGQWSLREPVAAPANPAAVQRLMGLLAGIKVADFMDGGGGSAGAAFTPGATVLIEHDRRELTGGASPSEAEARVKTESHTLEIGGPADSSGARLLARIDKARMVVIDARSVAELRLDAALFAWPHPTRLSPSEIGTIVLKRTVSSAGEEGGTAYRRDLDKWMHRTSAGETMLAGEDVRVVDSLLELLTGVKAEARSGAGVPASPDADVAVVEPRGYAGSGQVVLLSLAGSPLETVEVGRTIAGRLVLKTGAVYRSYPIDRVPIALVALVAPEPAVASPGEDAQPEIRNK